MLGLKLLLCAVIFQLSESVANPRRTCFYDGWSAQRDGIAKYTPDLIDPFLCTHLVFANAIVRKAKVWEIYRRIMKDTNNYKTFNNLTSANPNLKTLIMLSENDPGDLENMARDTTNRTTFISSIIPFLKKRDFGGLCLQWKGNSDYFKLMSQEIRQAFDAETASTNITFLFVADLIGPTLDDFNYNYDLNTIKETASNFDFSTLQSYALYDESDDTVTTHHSRRVPRSTDSGKDRFLNMKAIGDYFSFLGIPKSSMDMGIATYGRGYVLSNDSNDGVGVGVTGPAPASNNTATLGFRAYYELCKSVEVGSGGVFRDEGVPYFVGSSLWIGFDDIQSVTEKATWIFNEGYGGAAVWGLSFDDFSQYCSSSDRPYPLLNTLKDTFEQAVAPAPPKEYRRMCYFTTWAADRYGPGQFTVNEVDEFLCTHLIVAFAEVSSDSEIQASSVNDTLIYQDATSLKANNPDLKVLISVGGWMQGSPRFSHMVSGPKRRRAFAASVISFLRLHGFDGIDLAWQYPAQRHGSRPETDKKNFGILLKLLRQEFDAETLTGNMTTLILTAAVAAEQEHIDYAYDVKALSENLDFLSIMTFDMHGYWDEFTGHHSQLKPLSWESGPDGNLNLDWVGRYWHMRGVDKEKINIGVATYGRGFELSYAPYDWIGAYHDGPNGPGNYTDEEGFLAYYEICPMVASGDGAVEREAGVPHYVKDELWIGYDDEQSMSNKMQWLISEGYGGVMIWSMDLDDFRQTCASSQSRFPLINSIKNTLTGLANGTLTTVVTEGTTTWESSTMSSTTEEGPHINCTVLPVDGPYENPNNPRTFYKCSHDKAYLYWCPSDLEFNATLSICDYP
ncbi:chitotriosidase-1-like [Pecten maximus]|uniref:chitotriosidase-1-like n=1 Tax=Pecten maximus TaxID=6579 RepID=UPI001458569A|nr:chitotriosidase-1-like [Pecten maximus]